MSKPESSSENIPKITCKAGKSPKPVALIIKKDRSVTIRGKETAILMKNIKYLPQTLKNALFKEDIIYESTPDDFLKGNPLEKLIIVNMLDRLANASRTVVRYYSTSTNEILRELTSDNIVKLIGQKNYDTLFSALCSVINLESKVRGILSLLTPQLDTKDNSCKLEAIEPLKTYKEECCQTDENCMELLFKYKNGKKKRIRRSQLNPHVVTDKQVKPLKRIVIQPNKQANRKVINNQDMIGSTESQKNNGGAVTPVANKAAIEQNSHNEPLTELKSLNLNEDSNCSIGNLSVLSNFSLDNVLEIKNPNELLTNVDHYTNSDSKMNIATIKPESGAMEHSLNRDNWHRIIVLDGSEVKVPVKPEDDFHIATPEILKWVSDADRVKLHYYQAYLDWKYSLQKDADGYLPIHMAVINDDVDMLRRQCFVLDNLDVIVGGLTPLQMALLQDTPYCGALVATLLRYGADPLLTDGELRTPAHMAAEAPFEALQALVSHCQKQARCILKDHEELWKAEYAAKLDEDLSRILLDHICKAFDGQGYTPLMLASRLGLHRSVQLLLEASPSSVNAQTPNAGETALYLAVGAAYMHAVDRGNRSKVADHFKATITALVDGGADPLLENLSGTNVTDLLSENNIPELSLLVVNKITSVKFFNGKMSKNCDAFMLEDNAGEVSIKEFLVERKDGKSKVKTIKEINAKSSVGINGGDFKTANKDCKSKDKPIILENIEIPKLDTAKNSNGVFINNNSNVKFIKPQDKLEKVASNSSVATNIASSSNVAIHNNISKSNVSSVKNVRIVTPSGDTKYVVLNVSQSSIVGNAKLNSNFKIVNTTKTVIKRKTTQDGPSNKKQKIILYPTDDKKT